jgi:uncharacterized membrane protein YeaQ/YmgE (transglycosylase-associated protein family)
MIANVEAWVERAASFGGRVGSLAASRSAGEALTFAISMASAFYGSNSQQVEMIKRRADSIPKEKGSAYPEIMVYEFAVGCVQNMVAEIKGGLVQNIRLGMVGEVVADLVWMSRQAMHEKSVPVAAVLAAAAFEDLIRRLGQEKAGITDRIKLDQVLIELKEKGILQGGEPGVAQSFLKFRNDSLHADWNNVTEAQVSSCLGLLDSLIIKHLS